MTADAYPPGLTPDIVERCGHLIRQAAGRALAQKPLNPYELESVAAALLGLRPPRPSEFHDTRVSLEELLADEVARPATPSPRAPVQRDEGREARDLVQLKNTSAFRQLAAEANERVGTYIAGAGD